MHQEFLRVKTGVRTPYGVEGAQLPVHIDSGTKWIVQDRSLTTAALSRRIEVNNECSCIYSPPIHLQSTHTSSRHDQIHGCLHHDTQCQHSVTAGHHIVTFLTSSVNNMDIPPCERLRWKQNSHLYTGPSKVCS
jgi:hypothetical protein